MVRRHAYFQSRCNAQLMPVEGGKRPLSSSCPYIIEKDGQVALAGGSAGGSTIISANIQVARNVLVHGKRFCAWGRADARTMACLRPRP